MGFAGVLHYSDIVYLYNTFSPEDVEERWEEPLHFTLSWQHLDAGLDRIQRVDGHPVRNACTRPTRKRPKRTCNGIKVIYISSLLNLWKGISPSMKDKLLTNVIFHLARPFHKMSHLFIGGKEDHFTGEVAGCIACEALVQAWYAFSLEGMGHHTYRSSVEGETQQIFVVIYYTLC